MKRLLVVAFVLLPTLADAAVWRKQSSTSRPVQWLMVSSTDHVTPATGLTVTATCSKDAGAFGACSGSVSEVGNGIYSLAGNATDRGTLGTLVIRATATGADTAYLSVEVVSVDPFDGDFGLADLDAAISSRLAPTTNGRTLDVTATGEAGIDWANVGGQSTSVTLSSTTIGGVSGNVGGSVGSVATGGITSASFGAGAIDAAAIATDAIGAPELAAGAITTAEIATGAVDADALATDAADEVATSVWAAGTRTITGGTITTVNDKTGYSLTDLQSLVAHSGTAQAGAAGSITLAAGASATTDYYVGTIVWLYGGTGAGQARVITAYNGTTKVATIGGRNWATTPDGTTTYAVHAFDAPKTDTSLQVVAASVQGNVTGSVATVTGAVGSVTGSIGSVAAGGITASSLADNTITAAKIATDAFTSDELAASFVSELAIPTVGQIADGVWDEATSGHQAAGSTGLALTSATAPTAAAVADAVWDELAADHNTAGTMGNKLNSAASAGDPWSTTVPGAYGAGTAGYRLGYLDALVSSRAPSGTTVTVTNPVAENGDITLKQGDDYSTASGPAIDITYNGSVPITGLTPTLKIYVSGTAVSWTGTVIGSAAPWTIRFQPTGLQTRGLPVGVHRHDVEVTVSPSLKRTLVEGDTTVRID